MNKLKDYIDNYKSPQESDRKARRKGKNGTCEFFTPYEIVKKMLDKVPEEDWRDPTKTFLEPCCGSGNIVIGILYRRIVEYNIDWKQAVNTLFALDMLESNISETKERIHNFIKEVCPMAYDKDALRDVLDAHLVCSDFFEWNFQEWRKMTPEELKTTSKSTKKKNKKNV